MGVEVVNHPPDKILTIKAPLAGAQFEWHPKMKRVYIIRPNLEGRVVGETIAFDIDTHGAAINAVNIFMRGFKESQRMAALKFTASRDAANIVQK